jgi:DNA-binding XRE family transcriptional regulator
MSSDLNDLYSGRFRSERRRLDLTHSDVAKITGYSRNSVVSWEKGTAIPVNVLGDLSAYDFDVSYVCTGRRLVAESVLVSSESPVLTPDEWKLVKRFRGLGEAQQKQALAMVEVLGAGVALGGNTTVITGDNKRVAGRDYVENRGPAKPKVKK